MQYDVSHVWLSTSASRSLSILLFSVLQYMRRVPHSYMNIHLNSSSFLRHTFVTWGSRCSLCHISSLISLIQKRTLEKNVREQEGKNNRQKNFFSTKVSYFVLHFALKCTQFLWVCWKHSSCTSIYLSVYVVLITFHASSSIANVQMIR